MKTEKYCKRCDSTMSVDMFSSNKSRYDGLQPYCRECMKKYRREHYHGNKEQYYDRNKVSQDKARAYVLKIKNSTPCTDCGEIYINEPWLVEFDHLPEHGKKRSISEWIHRYGMTQGLIDEIARCELVCLICHRRRTAARGGWRFDRSDSAVV